MSTPIKDNLLNLINNLPRIVEPEISETPYYQILYEYKPFHTQFVSFYRIEVVSNDKSNYITPEDWFNQIVIYQHTSKHIPSDKSFKSIVLDSNRYTLSQTSIVDHIVSQNGISKESETNMSDENVSNIESQHISKHILSDDISKLVTQNILSQTSIINYITSQNDMTKESETNISDETVSNTESQHASIHILLDDVSNSIYFNLFNKILAINSVKNNVSLSSSSSIGLDDSYEITVQ